MGLTLAEKILSMKSGRRVNPGEIIEAKVDLVMIHDLTGPLTLRVMEEVGSMRVWDPNKVVVVMDHQVPADRVESANIQRKLRLFARKFNLKNFFEVGRSGICHQLLPEEGFVKPSQLIVGADSHTCTLGALGAFAIGVGSTDAAMAILTGEVWLKVPESMKIIVNGWFREMVTPKDLILKIIGEVGADGASYMSVEYHGEAVKRMSMGGRMTLCNMSVEMGAKTGMVEADRVTIDYLKSVGVSEFQSTHADEDAEYRDVREFDASEVEPMISIHPRVDRVKPVSELEGLEVDQVFIGSCTNGRVEDLMLAYRIIKGRRISENVRCIVIPASTKEYLKALRMGVLEELVKSGCVVCPPTCGPCLGGHLGVLGDFERAVSTSNRNFIGRMGSTKSEVYLVSPATAAATAVKGVVTDPRRVD